MQLLLNGFLDNIVRCGYSCLRNQYLGHFCCNNFDEIWILSEGSGWNLSGILSNPNTLFIASYRDFKVQNDVVRPSISEKFAFSNKLTLQCYDFVTKRKKFRFAPARNALEGCAILSPLNILNLGRVCLPWYCLNQEFSWALGESQFPLSVPYVYLCTNVIETPKCRSLATGLIGFMSFSNKP